MSLKYHPDAHPGDQSAADRFMDIAEAYDVLSDPKKRAVFDQFGEVGLKSGLPDKGEDFDNYYYGYTFHKDARLIFKEFFGGDNPFREIFDCAKISLGCGVIRGHGSKKKNPSIEQNLFLTLEEVFHGCTKKMKISRRVMCNNEPLGIHDKILTISVKRGWRPGTRITFSNEGDQGPNNIPADIVFTVRDKPHLRFRREGNNLIYKTKVSLACALLGCNVSIHTLDDRVLHIPITDIVKPGYTKMVHEEGMPLVAAPCTRGNLIIEFDVIFPIFLTPKKKELIRKGLCVP